MVTVCALCVLLVSMMIPVAAASILTSTATVDFGSTAVAVCGAKTLYGVALSGTVKSTTANSGDSVTGDMYTKGVV